MDFFICDKEVMITSQYAIVEGELQPPLRDLCDEETRKIRMRSSEFRNTQALPQIPL
jgi:hypothetical protein